MLRRKLRNLIYGEEGVALVVTLALFMFLYVSCAGVFAVGRAVKERILIQNAADAAAYSAAIAQADTLSRISAINRAMAWTYKDMVQRQHDYVLLVWLKEAFRLYQIDRSTKYRVYGDPTGSSPRHIWLNDYGPVSDSEIEAILGELPGIEEKIIEDSEQLREMYEKELELLQSLIGTGPDANIAIAEAIVLRVLEANLSGEYGKQCLQKLVINGGWWEVKTPNSGGKKCEDEFLRFDPTVSEIDEDAIDGEAWFPVSGDAICRHYVPAGDLNVARWYYQVSPSTPIIPQDPVRSNSGDIIAKRTLVAIGGSVEKYTAKPIVLKKEYFPAAGGKGAISVCIAHRTDNPWKFNGNAFGGIYDAFKPFSEHTRWARAVSSAQAGYRDGEEGVYSVRWKDDENWNLGTNDWDAVYVPVRKVFTPESFKNMIASDSGWRKVLDDGYDTLATKYSDSINNATYLPQMHNNANADNRLEWDADGKYRFLDLIFH